ncbi:hypothetical protein MF069_34735 [Paenibacillus mucilaginosus]|uniref:Uncharacterized protein n=1 Tax=Paenibacillus mucilaginosus (strain KNP414) TaxID=1036673 RepID=F8FHA1_PAEMK|nr:hypothetical protein KNP414_01236 [Paenibacillus mucilaginosus KNP414]MCG7217888.1 hypothetical protein [Paenibacillus mucilaginosus]
MRSREEQRQQNIPQGSSRQREAVKLPGYAGAPSSSPAQADLFSDKDQSRLLEKILEGHNLRLAYSEWYRTEECLEWMV